MLRENVDMYGFRKCFLWDLPGKQLNRKKSKRYRHVKAGVDKSNGQRISTTSLHSFSEISDMFLTDTQKSFL